MTPPRTSTTATYPPGGIAPKVSLTTAANVGRADDSLLVDHIGKEEAIWAQLQGWQARMEAKVDGLTSEFREHVAEDNRLNKERRQRDAVLKQLADGQQAVLEQLSVVRKLQAEQGAELARNTEVTEALADAGRVVGTVRRWLLWIGPVVIVCCGIAYGIWQLSKMQGGITP